MEITYTKSVYKHTLHDTGKIIDQKYSGIYSPIYQPDEIKRYMSSYYESQESADSQAKAIDMTDYYYTHIKRALNKFNYNYLKDSDLLILDIGAGFGSTTFPLLKVFPNSRIIASELSLSMLYAFMNRLSSHEKKRVELVQLNAEELDFHEDSFDLAVGAAILHHLMNPEKVIEKLASILKPRGAAIFFEPFENGISILGLIFREISKHKNFRQLQSKQRGYFNNCISTWQKMKLTDKSNPFFRGLDDKWLFTKEYFYSITDSQFQQCIIYSLDTSDTPFLALAETHFKGNNIQNLPDWVFDVIIDYESWFSKELKSDLLTEGCIILIK